MKKQCELCQETIELTKQGDETNYWFTSTHKCSKLIGAEKAMRNTPDNLLLATELLTNYSGNPNSSPLLK